MRPEFYRDIAPLLSRRQNVLLGSSGSRFNAYFHRNRAIVPRHTMKLVVPVLSEVVTIKVRDPDCRAERQVGWRDLIHQVRHGHIRKIKFRHVHGMQLPVDHAFDVMCHFVRQLRRLFVGSEIHTDILPQHWEWSRIFLRLFADVRSIHVRGQAEDLFSYAGMEHALQPYLHPKVHSMELFWIGVGAPAQRIALNWILAPSNEDRFISVRSGNASAVSVIRELHDAVLQRHLPVFNRIVIVIRQNPVHWGPLSAMDVLFLQDLPTVPTANPHTGARFVYTSMATYVSVVICAENRVEG
ncbi:hypothetical protein AAVH_18753 [Aphelenchoides avenae]|nr:hypothetical protein AAVH_18753 [Aphelenchus avenae]